MIPSTVQIEILTQDLGLVPPDVTGLGHAMQAAHVAVTDSAQRQLHVVIRGATAEPMSANDRTAFEKLFPDTIISAVCQASPGEIELECGSDALAVSHAAAAAATIQRSWSWDESPTIRVSVSPSGSSFVVNPVFSDGSWFAELSTGV
jgi:hypothetical protein